MSRSLLDVLLLVASGWYGLALGPIGLLLEGAGQLAALAGVQVIFSTGVWWICLAACLVLGGLAVVSRWRIGPPVSRPSARAR